MSELAGSLHERGTRRLLAEVSPDVRAQLDRYGSSELIGADAYFETVSEAINRFPAPALPNRDSRPVARAVHCPRRLEEIPCSPMTSRS